MEGAEPRVSVFFLKSVVQAILLFGSETLVVTPRMGRVLGVFQFQVAQRLTGRILQQKTDGKWEYILSEMAKEEAKFHMMEQYISQQQNTVAQYISVISLLYLCEGSERAPGARVGIRWWDQEDINLAGAREEAAAEAEAK